MITRKIGICCMNYLTCIYAIVFSCVISLNCSAQNHIYADDSKNILQLNDAYLHNDYLTFIELFPDNFEEFIKNYENFNKWVYMNEIIKNNEVINYANIVIMKICTIT